MIKLTPRERKQFNTRLDTNIKQKLEFQAAEAGLSQSEYLEQLIEGTLPGRIDRKIEELRQEVIALRNDLKQKK